MSGLGVSLLPQPPLFLFPQKLPDINQLLKTLSGSDPVSVDELLKTLGKASKGRKQPGERDVRVQDSED